LRLGTTCPHRRAAAKKGCIFCAEEAIDHIGPIETQLKHGLARLRGALAVAYLQDHTATLLAPERLEGVLEEITSHSKVIGITIGTRPDCLPDSILAVVADFANRIDLMVELGLQTTNERTLQLINRQHTVRCFELAVRRLQKHSVKTCAHVILGLPTPRSTQALGNETTEEAVATAGFLGRLGVDGVKIHNCHVLQGTVLADLYRQGAYSPPKLEGYINRLVPFLEHLPPSMEIHRLVGEARPPRLLAPLFTADKARTLDRIRSALVERDTWQGRLWRAGS
jgi:radical SAM protein (TIGR01212 family)